ncbi:MAG: hypothetical protein Q9218_003703 [Villophora microphyllina]
MAPNRLLAVLQSMISKLWPRHNRQPSTTDIPLLENRQQPSSAFPNVSSADDEPEKVAVAQRRWIIVLYCFAHMIPVVITLVLLYLNIRGIYWQDLGHPNQNSILQALQYAAKAHEVMIAASLAAIAIFRIQHDLTDRNGVPLGFLSAGFLLDSPTFILSRQFLGGVTARPHAGGPSRFFPLSILLTLCLGLTLVVGPSSAVAMIPRLDWWDVPKIKAFGPNYTDTIYFNRTAQELWPADVTNHIYADTSQCSPTNTDYEYCAVRAVDSVGAWIGKHQSQGTPPNITILQDGEIVRFLTSQGGPPDDSSFTVTSTIGSAFVKDLDHYWDWIVENSSLSKNISRPLLRPVFVDPDFKVKKPLVQAQCQSYVKPDYEHDGFEFPHDKLSTPPLDRFVNDSWRLPNSFVMNLKGNDSSIGNVNDHSHPWSLFDWFDTASNFSSLGAPSLGAVIIYVAYDNRGYAWEALTVCTFDGRWVPVEYYLDPKDTITIRQDTPNPMDVLKGDNKADVKDMVQMRMSLEWANSMNTLYGNPDLPVETAVEHLLTGWGGGGVIFTEPDHWGNKSLDWRLSTSLGLYLVEGLAYAFADPLKASMLYRKAPNVNQSYIRYLDNINEPRYKEGYRDGKLNWVEMRDPRWHWENLSHISHDPWDVWAPQNGYSEIKFTVKRNGYGYGFEGVPIKLATTVLVLYLVLALTHVIFVISIGRVYRGYSNVGDMLALAWSSPPAKELKNTSVGIERVQTWKHRVYIRKQEGGRQVQLTLGDQDKKLQPRLQAEAKYS